MLGEFQHTIDPKGRVILPSKFRDELGEKFIVTKGFDKCLFVYPQAEWNELEEKLKKLPIANKDARAFVRFFYAGAAECEVDKQGRVLIPQNLRAYAELDKDVYIIGAATRAEVWDKDRWETYNREENLDPDSIAEKMGTFGI